MFGFILKATKHYYWVYIARLNLIINKVDEIIINLKIKKDNKGMWQTRIK